MALILYNITAFTVLCDIVLISLYFTVLIWIELLLLFFILIIPNLSLVVYTLNTIEVALDKFSFFKKFC